MKEIKGDLFDLILDSKSRYDGIAITTNRNYTKDGHACMGGGCAKQCVDLWPNTSTRLAQCLKNFGTNIPFIIGALDTSGQYAEPNHKMIKAKKFKALIFSFPTINDLMQGADLELIKNSATEMINMVNRYELGSVLLGRPGAGIGGLSWAEVKNVIDKILDDRFTIVSFPDEL